MYTYNLFIFGHNLSLNKELNNMVHDFDFSFQKTINKKRFELDTPYHGGTLPGDIYPVSFGHTITDDDQNPNFVGEVRNAKEENYINDYNEFIKSLKEDLIADKNVEADYDKLVDTFISFIDNNKPGFYSIEVSS